MGILDGDSPFKDNAVALFIVQLMLILILSRILGKLLKFVKQPFVIAEMIAGILLGPSVFGLSAKFTEIFFPSASLSIIRVMANFGLILFMFLVGLEVDSGIFQSTVRRFAIISTIGVIVPFVCSIPVAYLLHNRGWGGEGASFGNFLLFLGVAMGVSALPVLARILAERQMLQAPLGVVTMSATAVDDLEGWLLLAIVVAVARAQNQLNILWTVLLAIANVLAVFFIVRPIFNRIGKRVEQTHRFTNDIFFLVIIILFAFSWIVDVIGLTAIFGAFEVGIVVPRNKKVIGEIVTKLEDIITVIFLPLYFTLSGLRTRFSLMNTAESWGMFILIFVVAFLSKMFGCAISAKFIGKLGWKESFCFGVLMQTKGLVALVVFNLGLDYGVISERLFTVNVLMVLLSTIATSPIVELIYPAKKIMQATLEKRQKGSLFGVLLCANNPKNARSMVTCIVPFVEGREEQYSYVIDILNIVETESEEGSYLTTWFFEKKMKFNKVIRGAKSRSQALGIKVHPKTVMNNNVIGQILQLSEQRDSDLIILSTDKPENPGRVIEGVIKNARCDIGLLILPPEKKTPRINKVLCSLLRTKNDPYVVKYATMMAQSQDLHLLLLHLNKPGTIANQEEVNEYTTIATKYSSMKYKNIAMEDTYDATKLESERNTYDMIVVGADENKSAQLSWIKRQNCYVLVIYGKKKNQTVTDKGEIELPRLSIEKV